jgi:hypothetical protein
MDENDTDWPIAGKPWNAYISPISGETPAGPAGLLMIGFLARFIGLWMVAGALVALVIDGTKTIAASALTMTPMGLAWYSISPSSLMQTQEFVQRTVESYIGHWLWDPIIQWVLMAPAWAVLGIIGGWLLYVGRRRSPQPAYA